MKIAQSQKMNKLRLEKLKVKIDFVNSVFEDARTQLIKKIRNNPDEYRKILKDLLIQGFIRLLDDRIYLCTLYSIYQFFINQYYLTLHKVMKILSNYFINYEYFCDLETFNKNMDKVRVTLISKLAFLKNDVLTKIYHAVIRKTYFIRWCF